MKNYMEPVREPSGGSIRRPGSGVMTPRAAWPCCERHCKHAVARAAAACLAPTAKRIRFPLRLRGLGGFGKRIVSTPISAGAYDARFVSRAPCPVSNESEPDPPQRREEGRLSG